MESHNPGTTENKPRRAEDILNDVNVLVARYQEAKKIKKSFKGFNPDKSLDVLTQLQTHLQELIKGKINDYSIMGMLYGEDLQKIEEVYQSYKLQIDQVLPQTKAPPPLMETPPPPTMEHTEEFSPPSLEEQIKKSPSPEELLKDPRLIELRNLMGKFVDLKFALAKKLSEGNTISNTGFGAESIETIISDIDVYIEYIIALTYNDDQKLHSQKLSMLHGALKGDIHSISNSYESLKEAVNQLPSAEGVLHAEDIFTAEDLLQSFKALVNEYHTTLGYQPPLVQELDERNEPKEWTAWDPDDPFDVNINNMVEYLKYLVAIENGETPALSETLKSFDEQYGGDLAYLSDIALPWFKAEVKKAKDYVEEQTAPSKLLSRKELFDLINEARIDYQKAIHNGRFSDLSDLSDETSSGDNELENNLLTYSVFLSPMTELSQQPVPEADDLSALNQKVINLVSQARKKTARLERDAIKPIAVREILTPESADEPAKALARLSKQYSERRYLAGLPLDTESLGQAKKLYKEWFELSEAIRQYDNKTSNIFTVEDLKAAYAEIALATDALSRFFNQGIDEAEDKIWDLEQGRNPVVEIPEIITDQDVDRLLLLLRQKKLEFQASQIEKDPEFRNKDPWLQSQETETHLEFLLSEIEKGHDPVTFPGKSASISAREAFKILSNTVLGEYGLIRQMDDIVNPKEILKDLEILEQRINDTLEIIHADLQSLKEKYPRPDDVPEDKREEVGKLYGKITALNNQLIELQNTLENAKTHPTEKPLDLDEQVRIVNDLETQYYGNKTEEGLRDQLSTYVDLSAPPPKPKEKAEVDEEEIEDLESNAEEELDEIDLKKIPDISELEGEPLIKFNTQLRRQFEDLLESIESAQQSVQALINLNDPELRKLANAEQKYLTKMHERVSDIGSRITATNKKDYTEYFNRLISHFEKNIATFNAKKEELQAKLEEKDPGYKVKLDLQEEASRATFALKTRMELASKVKSDYKAFLRTIDTLEKIAKRAALTQSPHTKDLELYRDKCKSEYMHLQAYREWLSAKPGSDPKRIAEVDTYLSKLEDLIAYGFNPDIKHDKVIMFTESIDIDEKTGQDAYQKWLDTFKQGTTQDLDNWRIANTPATAPKITSEVYAQDKKMKPGIVDISQTVERLEPGKLRLTSISITTTPTITWPVVLKAGLALLGNPIPLAVHAGNEIALKKPVSFGAIQQINGNQLITTLLDPKVEVDPQKKLDPNYKPEKFDPKKLSRTICFWPRCTLPHDIALGWAVAFIGNQIKGNTTGNAIVQLSGDYSKYGPQFVEAAMIYAAYLRKYEGVASAYIKTPPGIHVKAVKDDDPRVEAFARRVARNEHLSKLQSEITKSLGGTSLQKAEKNVYRPVEKIQERNRKLAEEEMEQKRFNARPGRGTD